MTENRYYHLEIDLPVSGSVREERKQIEALPGLEQLEAAVEKLGGTFKDGIIRRTGSRTLAGVTQPKPIPVAPKPAGA